MLEAAAPAATAPVVIGRYALFDELAAGGMATVHLGRLLGPVGFGRTVAVKRLHKHFLKDEEFITMFMDEARIVARIRHPNVVAMADVVQSEQGLFLVMEYVHGESLSRLMRSARRNGEQIPPRIVTAIMCGVLLGLHAAHETCGADGALLGVVHRDVSPQNIIVGADGSARVLDFGIAKAAGRAQVTREGQIKGKLAYMAPEQIRGQVDRRTDVFAASVVLWEMLAGRRLHEGSKDVDIVTRVVKGDFQSPSEFVPSLGSIAQLDAIVMRGLAVDPKQRFSSGRELAFELERTVGLASPSEVTEWVERLAKDVLEARGNLVTAMELAANDLLPHESNPPPPSLAIGATLVAPTPGIPVHVELDGEMPSSSARFAHTHTPYDARSPVGVPSVSSRPPRRMARMVVFAASALMAIVGVALGTYAVLHRAARAEPVAIASSSWAPSTSPLAFTASATSVVPPRASVTPVRMPAPSPAPNASPKASISPGPTSLAAPSTRAPAKAKPQCDPPYILDELGHRHYKPECD